MQANEWRAKEIDYMNMVNGGHFQNFWSLMGPAEELMHVGQKGHCGAWRLGQMRAHGDISLVIS